MQQSEAIKVRPWCVFCGQTVAKPQEREQRKLGEFSVGNCECGAVYTCDPTGYNIGSAMIEAMVYACNDDWDLAWGMDPEEDYLTGRIEKYDEQTDQVVEIGNLDGRAIKGVLYFVRLQKQLSEVANRQTEHPGSPRPSDAKEGYQPPAIEPVRDPKRKKRRANKTIIEEMTREMDIDGLVDMVFDDSRTLRFLLRLLYTPDDNFRWRTAFIIGKVCARLSTRTPGKVSDLLHRLFAACADSAASSWGAIEAIGAIISERPDIFGSFSRHLLNYMGDPALQTNILWALGSIGKNRPDLIRSTPFYGLFRFLKHPEPLQRGLTLRLLGHIKAHEVKEGIAELQSDQSPVLYYENGEPVSTTVAQLADEALELINSK